MDSNYYYHNQNLQIWYGNNVELLNLTLYDTLKEYQYHNQQQGQGQRVGQRVIQEPTLDAVVRGGVTEVDQRRPQHVGPTSLPNPITPACNILEAASQVPSRATGEADPATSV